MDVRGSNNSNNTVTVGGKIGVRSLVTAPSDSGRLDYFALPSPFRHYTNTTFYGNLFLCQPLICFTAKSLTDR